MKPWVRPSGILCLAGVDEVGRGPLAGDVVTAAVILPENHQIEGLADSKVLSARMSTKILLAKHSVGRWAGRLWRRSIASIFYKRH